MGKTEAVAMLARQAGIARKSVAEPVDALLARLPRLANEHVILRPAAELADMVLRQHMPARVREIAQPVFTNGRPACFPARSGVEFSPAFEVLEIPGGILAQVGRAPVALTADGATVIRDFSSPFAGLVHGYDFDLRRLVADAMPIAGEALVLCDDIFPLNFSHWLLDELPRVAFLGERRDVTLIAPEEDRLFKRETLRLCGFAASRVVPLGDFRAVRADKLLVPRDIAAMPHPAHKAAPWVLDFLRARVGFPALARLGAMDTPAKLFISRDDALGRRIVNEPALMAVLADAGYARVSLSGRGLGEQIGLFARATHVVGAHGAGLTHFAFAPAGASLLEIFPGTYGTPAYYVLAAGQGRAYATYVARDVVPGDRPQTDDIRLDIEDFRSCCDKRL